MEQTGQQGIAGEEVSMEEEKEKKWEKKKRKKRRKDEKAPADSPLEWKLLCHLVIILQDRPGHKGFDFGGDFDCRTKKKTNKQITVKIS